MQLKNWIKISKIAITYLICDNNFKCYKGNDSIKIGDFLIIDDLDSADS